MNKLIMLKDKWMELWNSSEPGRSKFVRIVCMTGRVLKLIAQWLWNLRGILLSIPVAFAALHLAKENNEKLPELVGLNLLETGEYAYVIQRDMAVFGPLVITAVCLLMVIISRKTLYPWLISVFSLILPIFLALTNGFFPA